MTETTLDFFTNRPTEIIAQDLLGRQLTYESPSGILGGLIVETEAYLGATDRAAHSFNNKRTPHSEGLYRVGGTLYIYAQRQYFFLDIATQEENEPQGILIRAIQPNLGIEQMELNRKQELSPNLTNGPAKLMQAFGLKNKNDNLVFLDDSPFAIDLTNKIIPQEISASPRVGRNQTDERWANAPLRFTVAHNPYLSRILKAEMDFKNLGWQKLS